MIRVKILLIFGHGAGDPGACACGYKEAELVREMAPSLKNILSRYAEVTVFDTSKNMYKYLKAGNSFNFGAYDYVFELHFNASVGDIKGNGKTTGTEILVHTSETGTSVEQAIVNNIAALGFKNRGVKKRSDLLNMNTCKKKQGVSYALLETCFIDDLDDMKLYHAKKDLVINAIASGIADGFGLKAKNSKVDTDYIDSPSVIANEINAKFLKIHEMDNLVKALEKAKKENSPLYWVCYRLVNNIKE